MALLQDLIQQIDDPALRDRILKETNKLVKQKKFGLVFEDHLPECTPLYDVPIRVGSKVALKEGKVNDFYVVQKIDDKEVICDHRETHEIKSFSMNELVVIAEFGEPIYPTLKSIDFVENAPDSDLWHTLIEADNYHALQLLEYLYAGKVDCIYIDPPYNTGAKDWKYNNDYVDSNDSYRHSKWLSMIEKRLKLAKRLLNPKDSVLIVTIDEKEYLHLGCLLEEIFPEAAIQMITDVINPGGTNRENEFSRVEEYLFICRFGDCSITKMNQNMLGNTDETNKARVWYSFNRGNNLRESCNNQFFPIYIDEKSKKIVKIGEPMHPNAKINDFPQYPGLISAFPINDKGKECIWRGVSKTIKEWAEKGYIRVSKYDEKLKRWTLLYIPSGLQKRIESGEIKVEGKRDDGSLDINHIDASSELVSPRTVWNQKNHNATDYGASVLKKLVPNHHFSYPKSLYSVKDALNFFVSSKPNALIVDFFAGSGTTLQAVNLLNAEDNGNRRCIMVTNNEVSNDEAKNLSKKGFHPGDPEWEKFGIAHYITWPRTKYSINGFRDDGTEIDGEYISATTKTINKSRNVTQIGFAKTFSEMKLADKKQLLSILSKGNVPQNLIETDTRFIVSDDDKHIVSVLYDDTAADEWLEALEGMNQITEFYIVTDKKQKFNSIKQKINDLLGDIVSQEQIKIPMRNGFKANANFFKLSFLDKTSVALGRQFKELLPVLWMKSGAVGKCPELVEDTLPKMLVLKKNRMAILIDETYYPEFDNKLKECPDIQTIYIVTDSESAYREMIRLYDNKECYQLYRDYLDNFRINTGR